MEPLRCAMLLELNDVGIAIGSKVLEVWSGIYEGIEMLMNT